MKFNLLFFTGNWRLKGGVKGSSSRMKMFHCRIVAYLSELQSWYAVSPKQLMSFTKVHTIVYCVKFFS